MTSKKLDDFGLYFITDSKLSRRGVIEDVKAAVKCGVKVIQYREKEASAGKMIEEAMQIKKICSKGNALFLVNDRIDVAIAVDADGVHLGKDDIPYEYVRKLLGKNKIIGLSAYTVEDALQSQRIGADYVGIGPIYPTATKKDAKPPIGLEAVRQLKGRLEIPLVAIGGINESNIDYVLNAGARNVAIISAIIAKEDVEAGIGWFMRKIGSYK